jgi:hypothetical protein
VKSKNEAANLPFEAPKSKVWIETWRVDPPHDVTISGRFGASVMFVYHSRLLDAWFWLQPNSIIEKIGEPQMIYIDEEWIAAHPSTRPRPESSHKIHRQKQQQLVLF